MKIAISTVLLREHSLEKIVSILSDKEVKAVESAGDVHVFHWLLNEDGKIVERRPLKEGRERREAYFAAIDKLPGKRFVMMEFVKDDALEQLEESLRILRLINGCS